MDGYLLCMVVVKLFKGVVMSDGLFDCEMVVCLYVGGYLNLILVIGKLCGYLDGMYGLVMVLVDLVLMNFVGLLSFVFCMCDVYVVDVRFDLV